ncbi:allantoicase, partial [Streptomyces fildesensis]|nr:allantoicase [Streptomyces sp. SID13588]
MTTSKTPSGTSSSALSSTSFTGDARPFGGGDPYGDYRRAELPFTDLVDLADRRLGAG